MKVGIIIIFFHVLCSFTYGFTPYQKIKAGYSDSADIYNVQVTGLPAIKDQKQLNLCYAFSSRALLQTYMCKKENKNCLYLSDDETPSLFDIASYDYSSSNKISEYGNSHTVLMNIIKSKKKVSSESCAPYNKISYTYTTAKIDGKKSRISIDYKGVAGAWHFLEESFSLSKNMSEPRLNELSDEIIDKLSLEIDQSDFYETLRYSLDLDSFQYGLFVPKYCRDDGTSLEVKEYGSGRYPEKNSDKPTAEETLIVIYRLLKNNLPLNLNFCTQKLRTPKKDGTFCNYHASVVKGIKKVCSSSNQCELMIQFHNSYGLNWQSKFNGGWVRLLPIINNLMPKLQLNWIQDTDRALESLTISEVRWLQSYLNPKGVRKKKNSVSNVPSFYQCGTKFSRRKLNDTCEALYY